MMCAMMKMKMERDKLRQESMPLREGRKSTDLLNQILQLACKLKFYTYMH